MWLLYFNCVVAACADPGGGGRGSGPPEIHNNLGFLSNTGPDPIKLTKLPSLHSMLVRHRHASHAF